MLKVRQAISTGGPFDQSTWTDSGESLPFSFTINNNTNELPIQTVPGVTGNAVDIVNPSLNHIATLYGVYVSFNAGLSAQSSLTLGVSVRRAGAQLGGSNLFSWLASGTGTPAFTAFVPLLAPANTANTSVLLSVNGQYRFVRLQGADVITLVATSTQNIGAVTGIATTLIN